MALSPGSPIMSFESLHGIGRAVNCQRVGHCFAACNVPALISPLAEPAGIENSDAPIRASSQEVKIVQAIVMLLPWHRAILQQ